MCAGVFLLRIFMASQNASFVTQAFEKYDAQINGAIFQDQFSQNQLLRDQLSRDQFSRDQLSRDHLKFSQDQLMHPIWDSS